MTDPLSAKDLNPTLSPEVEPSGKFTVRVPRSLHRKLLEQAKREGVSLNQFVTVALAEAIGLKRAA